MALTAQQIKSIDKTGQHSIGGGLYLQVAKSGSKSWLFRYQINGRRRSYGLGGYPTVSLSKARDHVTILKRDYVSRGIDPLDVKDEQRKLDAEKKAITERKQVTFKDVAEVVICNKEKAWKSPKQGSQWRASLRDYAYPIIGQKPVCDVSRDDVRSILDPIWFEKPETASRVRSRIETILSYAIIEGIRTEPNVAIWRGNLDHSYPARAKVQKVKNFSALPYSEISDFFELLNKQNYMSARALEFTILTACRTNEVLESTWDEFDLEKKIWTIPADRMKAGKEHRVPLSTKAAEILNIVRNNHQSKYVFKGQKPNKPLSNMAMLTMLKRLNRSDITVHGFRSTFGDWVAEQTNYAWRVGEQALAHQLDDKAAAAYQRADLLEKRADMMEDWARYCNPA